MTPIPQPGEIVEFIVRHFSHVDGENNSAFDKKLQRMAGGGNFLSDDTVEILTEALQDFLGPSTDQKKIACSNPSEIKKTLSSFRDHYLFAVNHLECGTQPAAEVRSVFDKYAVSLFVDLLTPLSQRLGFKIEDVIGHPEACISIVWKAYRGEKTTRALAAELGQKIIIQDTSWETDINRWVSGNGMRVLTIMTILKKFDFDLGFALALSNAYKKYCSLEMVEVSKHVPPFKATTDSVVQDVASIGRLTLENSSEQENEILDALKDLAEPSRAKTPGDSANTDACIKALREEANDIISLAMLSIWEGHHRAQMGDLKASLRCFDEASDSFYCRSASGLEGALTRLFAISAALGEKQVRKRWATRCKAVDLHVMPQESAVVFHSIFPNPYPEAVEWLPSKANKVGISGAKKWENCPPDLDNPNRKFRDWGNGPISQLHIFALLAQKEKVSALLKHGANANSRDKLNRSPLFFAIKRCDRDCYELLLSATSKDTINLRAKNGESCLHEAIEERHSDLVVALLEKGADVEIEGPEGNSPLFVAADNFRSPEQMLQDFMDPQLRALRAKRWSDTLRQTPSPFMHRNAEAWESTIEQNPGYLPQMYDHFQKKQSDFESCVDIVLALLDAGADISAKTPHGGLTPFLYAAELGDPWLFCILIEYGANVRDRLDNGMTALKLLENKGHNELATWFLDEVPDEDRLWLQKQ